MKRELGEICQSRGTSEDVENLGRRFISVNNSKIRSIDEQLCFSRVCLLGRFCRDLLVGLMCCSGGRGKRQRHRCEHAANEGHCGGAAEEWRPGFIEHFITVRVSTSQQNSGM